MIKISVQWKYWKKIQKNFKTTSKELPPPQLSKREKYLDWIPVHSTKSMFVSRDIKYLQTIKQFDPSIIMTIHSVFIEEVGCL